MFFSENKWGNSNRKSDRLKSKMGKILNQYAVLQGNLYVMKPFLKKWDLSHRIRP